MRGGDLGDTPPMFMGIFPFKLPLAKPSSCLTETETTVFIERGNILADINRLKCTLNHTHKNI